MPRIKKARPAVAGNALRDARPPEFGHGIDGPGLDRPPSEPERQGCFEGVLSAADGCSAGGVQHSMPLPEHGNHLSRMIRTAK